MKYTILLFSMCFLAHGALAQQSNVSGMDLGSGRFADFTQVDQFTLSSEQMEALENNRELQTMMKVVGENTVQASSGHVLFSSDERNPTCGDSRVHCFIILGESDMFFPFASDGGLGTTRVVAYQSARHLQVNEAQSQAIRNDRELHGLVEFTSDDTITATGRAKLISTNGDSDCGSPRVSCGVVYEIETTLRLFGI